MRLISLFLIIASISFSAFGQRTVKDQVNALEAYLQEQRVHNSGIDIKEDLFDLKIDELRKLGTKLIKEATTLEEHYGFWKKTSRQILPEMEFEQLLIGLTAMWQDGHHNTMRQGGGHWDLGLSTAATQGRLIIVGHNEKILPKGSFDKQLQYGDEIVAINGQPVMELAEELLIYTRMFGGTYESQLTTALESIVSRSGRFLRPVKEGESVDLTIRRNGAEFEGTLNWVDVSKMGEEIRFYAGINPAPPKKLQPKPYTYGMSSQKMSQFKLGVQSMGFPKGAIIDIGSLINDHMNKEIQAKIPSNLHSRLTVGPIDRLDAYTIRGVNPESGKHFHAGVIRLPSYHPAGGYLQVVREFNWMAEAIERMNNFGVDFFIMDANANGGGYIDYASNLMRLFTANGEIKTGSLNAKLTKSFLNMLKQSAAEGVSANFIASYGDKGLNELKNSISLNEVVLDAEKSGSPIDIDLKDYYGSRQANFADKKQGLILYEELSKMRADGYKWSGYRPYLGTYNGISEGKSGRVLKTNNPVMLKPFVFASDKYSFSCGDIGGQLVRDNCVGILAGEPGGGGMQPLYRGMITLSGSEMPSRGSYGVLKSFKGQIGENMGAFPNVVREVFYEDVVGGFKQYAYDFLQMGIMASEGKTVEEISIYIKGNVANMLTGGKAPPKDILSLYDSSVKLVGEVYNFTPLKDNEKIASGILKLYKEFNEELAIVKDGGFTKFGNLLEVPIPYILLRDDQMLASVIRSRSVVDRLKLLSTHSKYKKSPNMVELINELIITFSTLDNVATMNTCETAYVSTETFKKTEKRTKTKYGI